MIKFDTTAALKKKLINQLKQSTLRYVLTYGIKVKITNLLTKIKNLGNRHMPQLVETEFPDGSTKRIWWKNN